MSPALIEHLTRDGHLTRIIRLTSLGHSEREIERAVSTNELIRVARGWVATSQATHPEVTAVTVGGKLTGSTALASGGIWSGVDRRIHVALSPHSTGRPLSGRSPDRFPSMRFVDREVVRHWGQERFPESECPPWRVSLIDALIRVARDSSSEHFVASVDSAIHLKALSRAAVPQLFSLLPRRLSHLQDDVDGRAESGIETLPRLRLSSLVRLVEIQVRIPGISRSGGDGRVDILLDGWLVVEADGDEFHDTIVDRERDALLVRLGYRVQRFGYDQIVNRWHEVEATILELLRYPPADVRRAA